MIAITNATAVRAVTIRMGIPTLPPNRSAAGSRLFRAAGDDRGARFLFALLALFLIDTLASPASASLDAEEAEALAMADWFEGVPDDRISRLTPAAVARLEAMLSDPARSLRHAAIIELLGRAGGPGVYEILAALDPAPPEGEVKGEAEGEVKGAVDREVGGEVEGEAMEEVEGSVYRARLAVPLALGYLAREDDRALQRLLSKAESRRSAHWRFRHLDEVRLAELMQMQALTGLAVSGRGDALRTLQRLSQAPDAPERGSQARRSDDRIREHAREMTRLHAEMRVRGREE